MSLEAEFHDLPLRFIQSAEQLFDGFGQHGAAISRTFARYASDMTDWAFNGALRGGEYTYRVYLFTKD